jgi:hypothetical protein
VADVYTVPAKRNYEINRGETFEKTYTLPYSITDYTYTGTIELVSAGTTYSMTVTKNNANKTVTITYSATNTALLSKSSNTVKYVWYLRQTKGAVITRLIEGDIKVE